LTLLPATSRERRLAYVAWITICIVWGTTYLAIRVALESMPVALLAGLRWTAAGLLLMPAVRLTGQTLPHPRTWGAIATAAFLMVVLGNGAVVWAEQHVASELTAVILAIIPFWNVLSEALFKDGERPDRRTLIGLAVGFAGIVVLLWPELFTPGPSSTWFVAGVVALQVACVGWALGNFLHQAQHGVGVTAGDVGTADARRRRDVPDHRNRDRRVEPAGIHDSIVQRLALSGDYRIGGRVFRLRVRAEASAGVDRLAVFVRQSAHRRRPRHALAVRTILQPDARGLGAGVWRHCRCAVGTASPTHVTPSGRRLSPVLRIGRRIAQRHAAEGSKTLAYTWLLRLPERLRAVP
jgi:hypothetical protein